MRTLMVLNSDGEEMEATAADPRDLYYNRQSDTDKLEWGLVGVHKGCDGWINLRLGTVVNAMYCAKCGLRVVVPKSLKTYADLRTFLAKNLKTPA